MILAPTEMYMKLVFVSSLLGQFAFLIKARDSVAREADELDAEDEEELEDDEDEELRGERGWGKLSARFSPPPPTPAPAPAPAPART